MKRCATLCNMVSRNMGYVGAMMLNTVASLVQPSLRFVYSGSALIQLVYRHSTQITRNKLFQYNITGLKNPTGFELVVCSMCVNKLSQQLSHHKNTVCKTTVFSLFAPQPFFGFMAHLLICMFNNQNHQPCRLY